MVRGTAERFRIIAATFTSLPGVAVSSNAIASTHRPRHARIASRISSRLPERRGERGERSFCFGPSPRRSPSREYVSEFFLEGELAVERAELTSREDVSEFFLDGELAPSLVDSAARPIDAHAATRPGTEAAGSLGRNPSSTFLSNLPVSSFSFPSLPHVRSIPSKRSVFGASPASALKSFSHVPRRSAEPKPWLLCMLRE